MIYYFNFYDTSKYQKKTELKMFNFKSYEEGVIKVGEKINRGVFNSRHYIMIVINEDLFLYYDYTNQGLLLRVLFLRYGDLVRELNFKGSSVYYRSHAYENDSLYLVNFFKNPDSAKYEFIVIDLERRTLKQTKIKKEEMGVWIKARKGHFVHDLITDSATYICKRIDEERIFTHKFPPYYRIIDMSSNYVVYYNRKKHKTIFRKIKESEFLK